MSGSEGLLGRRFLMGALGLAGVLSVVFAGRVVGTVIAWEEQSGPPLAGWMTIGFIAQTRDTDRDDLAEALGLNITPEERVTLEAAAARTGRTLPEVKRILEQTILEQTLADPAARP